MTKICHKCNKRIDNDNDIRTYRLALKRNINPNSLLAKVDQVNLCLSCDAARTTNIVRYIDGA